MPALYDDVRARAGNRCEYCLIPQSADITPHQIDHITARMHGGPTSLENLALACLRCNTRKGPNVAGVDPVTNRVTPLYHPRKDQWKDHFSLSHNGFIVAKTAVGRTTLYVLTMNDAIAVTLRSVLIQEHMLRPTE